VYRDLVRTSLILGARFLVLGVMLQYRHKSGAQDMIVESYRESKNQLDAIYASRQTQAGIRGRPALFGY
jgi:hypothetical protein